MAALSGEDILMEIAVQYIKIYKEFNNILPTTLTSAIKLDTGTRDKIVQLLGERANAKIELSEEVDEEIIGGFILEFEDKQYDASISNQLNLLLSNFEGN